MALTPEQLNAIHEEFNKSVGDYRLHLEAQLKFAAQVIAALLAITAAVFFYFFKESADDLAAYARTEVNERVLNYEIQKELQDRVRARVESSIRNAIESEPTKKQITKLVETTLGDQVGRELNAAVAAKAREIQSLDLKSHLLPVGTILAWDPVRHGPNGENLGFRTVPSGWRICDGQEGTPSLSGRFLYGASMESAGAAGGSLAVVGGEHTHEGTTGQANIGGYHNSTAFQARDGSSLQNHTHSFITNADGAHTHADIRPPYYSVVFIVKVYPGGTEPQDAP